MGRKVNENQLSDVGKRIDESLKALGMKSTDLSNELGVSRGAVSAWMLGRNDIKRENLEKLCALLGHTEEWILYGRVSMNDENIPLDILDALRLMDQEDQDLLRQMILTINNQRKAKAR